jgi:hypothetical protein
VKKFKIPVDIAHTMGYNKDEQEVAL